MKFVWSEQRQKAFNDLKRALTTTPILSFTLGNGRLILDTDASRHEIGAVFSQVQQGAEKVIAYYSRILSKSERNYYVTRRELLVIVNSVQSFHHYLFGRNFLIQTDHALLKWLMSLRELKGQLARWLERLQRYDFDISHRNGKSHKNADELSRCPCAEVGCKHCSQMKLLDIQEKNNLIVRINLQENLSEKFASGTVGRHFNFSERKRKW